MALLKVMLPLTGMVEVLTELQFTRFVETCHPATSLDPSRLRGLPEAGGGAFRFHPRERCRSHQVLAEYGPRKGFHFRPATSAAISDRPEDLSVASDCFHPGWLARERPRGRKHRPRICRRWNR